MEKKDMMHLDLVTTNVYSKHLSNKLFICGTCLVSEWPDIVEELRKDRVLLTVCLEMVHINTVIEKIASVLAKGDIKEIIVLSKDGSPHCIGLHFAVEWAVKMTKSINIHIEYYALEHGKLYKIEEETVKNKRHLSKK